MMMYEAPLIPGRIEFEFSLRQFHISRHGRGWAAGVEPRPFEFQAQRGMAPTRLADPQQGFRAQDVVALLSEVGPRY